MDDHVVFFFGAGISVPSGMPRVDEITQKVLEAPLVLTEHDRYVFPSSMETNPNIGQPCKTCKEDAVKVQEFINTVWEHAHTMLSQYGRKANYEDLYALCGEVVSDQEVAKAAVDPINLTIRSFSETLRKEAEEYLLRNRENPPSDLFHTANEANFLISGVVRELLSMSPDKIRGLDPLLKAIQELGRVTIVTLNHDLLLERFLEANDVEFVDGFQKVDYGVEKYSPDLLFGGSADVTVVKPHGSIDWYQDMDRGEYFSFSSLPPDPNREGYNLRPEPSILSGYRKEERYTTGIFGDMVDALVLALHEGSTVIESGFGWGDYGMDRHLRRYLTRSDQNQLLILHPENDFRASHLFRGRFQGVPDNLHLLQEYLCDISWEEVKGYIKQI